MTWSEVILHARLFLFFFINQPWNPWQILAKSQGSAKPRLKITALTATSNAFCKKTCGLNGLVTDNNILKALIDNTTNAWQAQNHSHMYFGQGFNSYASVFQPFCCR